MKSLKVALASLAVLAVIVGAFAFTSKKETKRAQVTISLMDNTCNQKIPASSGNEDCREDNLNSTTFTASNWTTGTNSATLGNGSYINKLVFSDADYSTIAAALADVQAYYSANGSLPADGQDIVTGSKHITVRRATSVF
jgi:hypothetical protein